MSITECIRENLPHAVVARCSEKGCNLSLTNLASKVVLKGEKLTPGRRICDCIIVAEATEEGMSRKGGWRESRSARSSRRRGGRDRHEGLLVAVVELKGGTADAKEVAEKLELGTVEVLEVLKSCGADPSRMVFLHLVLAGRWRTSEYRIISSTKILIQGRRYDIILERCGASLKSVIERITPISRLG